MLSEEGYQVWSPFCYHPVISQAEEEIGRGNNKLIWSLGSSPPRLREGSLCQIWICLNIGLRLVMIYWYLIFKWFGWSRKKKMGHWEMDSQLNLIKAGLTGQCCRAR
jgi:hypothetical protein